MSVYVRPVIADQVFRDADGHVIDYGNRWGSESPPEDTYSVDTHPERFAPLHTIADALVAHLVKTYDVEVSDDPAVVEDLDRQLDDVVRAVRLTPASPRSAVLTIVYTSYPSVVVHAGLLHDFLYPVCGCDACDEPWQTPAEDLELLVDAVVTGHYGERVDRGPGLQVHYAMGDAGDTWRQSGSSRAKDIDRARLRAARPVLAELDGGPWAPWPRRLPPD